MESLKYLNVLYGKILYVLQINPDDEEFREYKKVVSDFKSSFR